jgi:hypothetical protein
MSSTSSLSGTDYVKFAQERSRQLMRDRAEEIEAGLVHLTEAAQRDRDRYG